MVYTFFTFSAQIDILNEEIADLEGDGGNECDSGRILETQKVESTSDDVLYSGDTTKTLMKDMNLSITTYGESYLAMRLFTYLYLQLDNSSLDPINGRCDFNVSIDFNDKSVSVATITHVYKETPDPYGGLEISYTIPIYLEYITTPLSAGTYNIKVMWLFDYSSFSSIGLYTNPFTSYINSSRNC